MRIFFALLVLFVVCSSVTLSAESKHIISASQLLKMKKQPVLLHIGRKDDFERTHIPGAQHISTRDVSTTRDENPLILELPPVERLAATFEKYGISNDSKVVLYWGKDWVTPTTRVFFTLDYLGLADNVAILDGGMPAWIKAGGKATHEVFKPKSGKLKVNTRPLVAKMDEIADAVLNNKPLQVVDARAPKFYEGDPGSFKRGGHIPNATNIPYTAYVTSEYMFKSRKELKKLFTDAGISKDKKVVTYCHIGQQASLAYFAARILGYDVRIYDGSFNEWSESKHPVQK